MKKENPIEKETLDFTVDIAKMCDMIQGRGIYVSQIIRSSSSIGANVYEAEYAQSVLDFINKLEIALKECYETEYWLKVLFRVDAIDENTFSEMSEKCGAIRRKLISSIKTVKRNNNIQ